MTKGEAENLVDWLSAYEGFSGQANHNFFGSTVTVYKNNKPVTTSGNPGGVKQAVRNGWYD